MCEGSVQAWALFSALAITALQESSAGAEPVAIPAAPAAAPAAPAASASASPAPSAPSASAPEFTAPPEPPFTAPPPNAARAPSNGVAPASSSGVGFAPSGGAAPAASSSVAPAPGPPAYAPMPAYAEGPRFAGYVAQPAAEPPPPPARPWDARSSDANVDHVVLVPTAETHPAGTVFFSDYDIVLGQIGYAASDRVEITLSGVPPLGGQDPIGLVDLSLKGVAVRSDRFRLAAIGSVTGLVGFEDSQDFAGRVGAAATLCFDAACRSTANAAATALLAGPALLMLDGFGAVLRASDLVAVLVEAQSALPVSREGGQFHGLGGAFGVRLSGRTWGVDLAFEVFGNEKTGRVRPLPVIGVTFRILP